MATKAPKDTKARGQKAGAGDLFSNPILVGSIMLIVTAIGVLLSYNANKGLPYVPVYAITAEVPDAAELTAGGSEVRIGGARIGIVKEIEALPATKVQPARASLKLELEKDQAELPVDTRIAVRPRSILGAKYLDLVPGKSKQGIPPGGTIPTSQAEPIVELDEAFNVFDDETSEGLRRGITALGDGIGGRGVAINDTITELHTALPPAQRVLGILADPTARLEQVVSSTANIMDAVRPVAPQLPQLLDNGATTFAAISAAGPALESTLDELPRTNTAVTAALRAARPVLADAASISADIEPGARILPGTAAKLTAALKTATPVLGRTPALATRLKSTLAALGALAKDPAAPGAVRKLITTVQTLQGTLGVLLPAQKTCNILGLMTRNLAGVVSHGDANGPWLGVQLVIDVNQMLQSPTPAANLHVNPGPRNDASECETGNEPYGAGRVVGNPAGTQPAATETTAPPATATARARSAGLLGGAR